MKTLFILIRPKGSGKTYIGTLVNTQTEIKFLSVEPIWLKPLNDKQLDRDGWDIVEEAINQLFKSYDWVMIESLGAGEGLVRFYRFLMTKYKIKLIKIETALDKCLERVKNRESTNHIPISSEQIEVYNKIAAQVSYNWDLVIDNNAPASDLDIIEAIKTIQ